MLSIIALAAAHCAELKAQSSPKLEITSARTEADACRATGVAHPLPGSRIGFELRTLDVAPDFRRFRAKGGKIVSYFGWADSLIAPRLALDFFHRAQPAPDYYRLFMVPGMGHCQGGVGPVR